MKSKITQPKNLSAKLFFGFAVFVLFLGFNAVQAVEPFNLDIPDRPIRGPLSQPITLPELSGLLRIIGNFLIVVAPILFVISLIMSGIWFMKAGADPNALGRAKSWLGYSIVGGLIIFGVGVMINTVTALLTRELFCRVGIGGICLFY